MVWGKNLRSALKQIFCAFYFNGHTAQKEQDSTPQTAYTMNWITASVKDERKQYKDKKEDCNRKAYYPYKQGSKKHLVILKLRER